MEIHCLKVMETTLGIQNGFLLKREHFKKKYTRNKGFMFDSVNGTYAFSSMLIDLDIDSQLKIMFCSVRTHSSTKQM